MLLFPETEYRQRIHRTKERMQAEGIDVLFVSQPANMNYLTGYDGWSFYVHQGVILPLDGEPIWVGRGMDGNGAKLTTFLKPDNILSYADDYVQSKVKHPMMFVADVIKARGWATKRIGVEMDQFYFTHRNHVELEKALPGASFKDANLLVNMVRQIKSDAEIRFMKIAGQIAVKVMQTAIDVIDVGVRECDAAAMIAAAEYRGTDEYGGDYPAIVPLMMSGKGTSAPHLTWTDRKYVKNEPIVLELAGVYKHYHAPIARTMFLGTPPSLLKEVADVVTHGLGETLQVVKPGTTCEEVEARWRRAISGTNVVKESRIGYSIGLNYPPDWGEQTMSLRPGDKTALEPNMAFHIILGIWEERVGFEADAAIRITEKGYEPLYEFPNKLFVK